MKTKIRNLSSYVKLMYYVFEHFYIKVTTLLYFIFHIPARASYKAPKRCSRGSERGSDNVDPLPLPLPNPENIDTDKEMDNMTESPSFSSPQNSGVVSSVSLCFNISSIAVSLIVEKPMRREFLCLNISEVTGKLHGRSLTKSVELVSHSLTD